MAVFILAACTVLAAAYLAEVQTRHQQNGLKEPFDAGKENGEDSVNFLDYSGGSMGI